MSQVDSDAMPVMLDSRCVYPSTLITETLSQTMIIGRSEHDVQQAVQSQTTSRNRLKREQRRRRRKVIKQTIDLRKCRDLVKIVDLKRKNSIKLQRRAIKGYWKTGIACASDASIADHDLIKQANNTEDKNNILFGSKHSFERDKMHRRMNYSFKRARMAIELLQETDMIIDPDKDIRQIDKADICSIVINKKIIRK